MAIPSDGLKGLESADPGGLELDGQRAALQAFHSAVSSPAYAKILVEAGLDPRKVDTMAAFESLVPVLSKEQLFGRFSPLELCREGRFDRAAAILPSSGHGNSFSFGLHTREELDAGAAMTDLMMEHVLRACSRKTLIINSYPMGVQVRSKVATANTGSNVKVAFDVVRTFKGCFEQMILIGMPLFIKHLLEAGVRADLDWGSVNASLVTGGENCPENLRRYFCELIGIEPDKIVDRLVGSSMGLGEIDLNLFHETRETINITLEAVADPALRADLFGDVEACPRLFLYYPSRTHLETLPVEGRPWGELVITNADPQAAIPLIRYRTGDRARIIPHRRLAELAEKRGLEPPALRLPAVAVYGRNSSAKLPSGEVYPEMIQEALFSPPLCPFFTGYFRAWEDAGALRVDVELALNCASDPALEDKLTAFLRRYLPQSTAVKFKLWNWGKFPYLNNYEQKFPYLG
ncbi:MAG: hypothetical protein HY549_11755 [Elusimicrobia bacterium]|nr:hypothetical protein [Elusimicrobiota bacterium]